MKRIIVIVSALLIAVLAVLGVCRLNGKNEG